MFSLIGFSHPTLKILCLPRCHEYIIMLSSKRDWGVAQRHWACLELLRLPEEGRKKGEREGGWKKGRKKGERQQNECYSKHGSYGMESVFKKFNEIKIENR